MELQNRLLLKSYAVKIVSISEGEMGSGNVWGIGRLRGRSHEDVVRENRGYCVLLKWKVSVISRCPLFSLCSSSLNTWEQINRTCGASDFKGQFDGLNTNLWIKLVSLFQNNFKGVLSSK